MKREEIIKTAKPILFNSEMVRAILDGRKTQTRRVKGYILAYKYTDSLIWWLISHNFPKDAAVIKIKAEDIPKI